MKLKLVLCMMVVILTGCAGNNRPADKDPNTQSENVVFSEYSAKTGIVIQDVTLIEPYVITVNDQGKSVYMAFDYDFNLKKGDMVLVTEEGKDYCRVIEARGDLPKNRGYILSSLISFDETFLENANQAEIDGAMTYDSKDGNEIGKVSGFGTIEERDGDWFLMELPGGGNQFWIKKTSATYNIDSVVTDISGMYEDAIKTE